MTPIENQLRLSSRDLLLAIATILVWPFLANFVLAFVGLFWVIGGAKPEPGIIGWGALIVSWIILLSIACFPALVIWRTSKRWSHILIYVLTFILYLMAIYFITSYSTTPHFNEDDRLQADVESQFQKSIYGKWETTYNGKPLIIEFTGGVHDSPDDFMRGGDSGQIAFYIPGEMNPLDTALFFLNESEGIRTLSFSSDIPLTGFSVKRLWLVGEIKTLSTNKLEFLARDGYRENQVQKMELIRTQ